MSVRFLLLLLLPIALFAQSLPVRWDELVAGGLCRLEAPLRQKSLGEFDMKAWVDQIANAIRAVKSDRVGPRLQKEFFEMSTHPNDTKQ